jgi:hypothetical protein
LTLLCSFFFAGEARGERSREDPVGAKPEKKSTPIVFIAAAGLPAPRRKKLVVDIHYEARV